MTRSRAVALTALAAILIACTIGIVSALSAPFGAPHPAVGMSASGLTGSIFAEQAAFYRSLSGFIRASKEDGAAIWELFGISFVYGIFHAVGPGHGKAVISSYVVANEEDLAPWIARRDNLRRFAIKIGLGLGFESSKILLHRARLPFWFGPLNLVWRLAMVAAGIGFRPSAPDLSRVDRSRCNRGPVAHECCPKQVPKRRLSV